MNLIIWPTLQSAIVFQSFGPKVQGSSHKCGCAVVIIPMNKPIIRVVIFLYIICFFC